MKPNVDVISSISQGLKSTAFCASVLVEQIRILLFSDGTDVRQELFRRLSRVSLETNIRKENILPEEWRTIFSAAKKEFRCVILLFHFTGGLAGISTEDVFKCQNHFSTTLHHLRMCLGLSGGVRALDLNAATEEVERLKLVAKFGVKLVEVVQTVPGFIDGAETHITWLRKKYQIPLNSEIPIQVPKKLHDEWIYLGDRSYGQAFRDCIRLLMYGGIVGQIGDLDIMAGRGFFDNDLAPLRRSLGFI